MNEERTIPQLRSVRVLSDGESQDSSILMISYFVVAEDDGISLRELKSMETSQETGNSSTDDVAGAWVKMKRRVVQQLIFPTSRTFQNERILLRLMKNMRSGGFDRSLGRKKGKEG